MSHTGVHVRWVGLSISQFLLHDFISYIPNSILIVFSPSNLQLSPLR